MNVAIHDTVSPRGTLHYRVYRYKTDGSRELIEDVTDHNLVVNAGRNLLARLVCGDTTEHVTQIGVGVASAAAQLSDTLTDQWKLFALTSHEVDGNNVIFHWHLTRQQANNMDITEFALVSNADVMMTHQVRGRVIGKEADLEIEGTYTLHF